jgi:SPP1 family predicted phage head-tail adaptor
MWKELIKLGNLVETIEHGEPIQSYQWREVFANKKSVRQSEFYQAGTIGLRPELIFEVHSFEFDNDEKVKYNDKEYTIIRVFDKGEITELIVSSHVGSEV